MSKLITSALLCILILVNCQFIFADQIILKNGDRVSGTILKKDGDKIVIETKSAGIITIMWDAVEKIVSEQPLNIKLADGQLIKGTVTADDSSQLAVATQDAGKVVIDKEKIEIVRNEAEQTKFDAERDRFMNPRFSDLWTGSADVGLTLTSGNSESKTFTAGLRGARTTTRDKISVYANALYSNNSTTGVSITTANALWAGVRYDYNVNKKLFVFGSADFEHDVPQLLDLRSVFGAGLGYRAIRNEKTSLDLFAGGAYNMEYFSTGERGYSTELLFGDELSHKLNSRMSLNQRLSVFPNVSDFGRFRSQFDASLLTDINGWLGWHISLTDRFDSDPVFGAEKNDLLLSTGLRVTFGRKE